MKVHIINIGMATVLKPEGRLDSVGSVELQKAIDEQLSLEKHYFAIDLTKTDYVASVGMRVLLGLAKRLLACKGEMRIVRPSDPIYEMFTMANLDTVLDFRCSMLEVMKNWPPGQQVG